MENYLNSLALKDEVVDGEQDKAADLNPEKLTVDGNSAAKD